MKSDMTIHTTRWCFILILLQVMVFSLLTLAYSLASPRKQEREPFQQVSVDEELEDFDFQASPRKQEREPFQQVSVDEELEDFDFQASPRKQEREPFQQVSVDEELEDFDFHTLNWTEPIPVLVFVCNRSKALLDHVGSLVKYRGDKEKLFPIYVSQDCDDPEVSKVIAGFGDKIKSMKNPTLGVFGGYAKISRHYKLALDRLFAMNYTSVIITEDDLAISVDFFNYFSNTRYLLDADPTLWCVSAWNDNGKENQINKEQSATLYRSDFFPGLGWMMTNRLWAELSPQWPKVYWDDWMRDPKRRKVSISDICVHYVLQNRQCIRPECGRTAMTEYGLQGVSGGLYSDTHSKMPLGTLVDFSETSLDYLLPDEFHKLFLNQINNESILIKNFSFLPFVKTLPIRFEYGSRKEFEWFAKELGLIHDEKFGVPRTAYEGIVTCYVKDRRIYLTPDTSKFRDYGNLPEGKIVTWKFGSIQNHL